MTKTRSTAPTVVPPRAGRVAAVAVALVAALAPRPAAGPDRRRCRRNHRPGVPPLPRRGSGVLPGVRLGRGRRGPLARARGLPAEHTRGRDVARGQRAGGVAVPGRERGACVAAVRSAHASQASLVTALAEDGGAAVPGGGPRRRRRACDRPLRPGRAGVGADEPRRVDHRRDAASRASAVRPTPLPGTNRHEQQPDTLSPRMADRMAENAGRRPGAVTVQERPRRRRPALDERRHEPPDSRVPPARRRERDRVDERRRPPGRATLRPAEDAGGSDPRPPRGLASRSTAKPGEDGYRRVTSHGAGDVVAPQRTDRRRRAASLTPHAPRQPSGTRRRRGPAAASRRARLPPSRSPGTNSARPSTRPTPDRAAVALKRAEKAISDLDAEIRIARAGPARVRDRGVGGVD